MSDIPKFDGDYIVFADESGDHEMENINPDYPIFVLCFCITRKDYYVNVLTPKLQQLKMKHWGHDQVILHERDIVKKWGEIGKLPAAQRRIFMDDLNQFMMEADMRLVAAVIRKDRLKERYANPFNPYHIGLKFCLERTHAFLLKNGQAEKHTFIVAESRGKKEDTDLKEEFGHITAGNRDWAPLNSSYEDMRFSLYCAPKGANSPAMQIADLTARPIGLSRLRPEQSNRAFELIKPKLWEGVKTFP